MKCLMVSVQRNLNILGLKLLHQLLLEHGHESHLLYTMRYDENNPAALQKLRDFIQNLNPGIIALSLTASEFYSARSLTLLAKQWFPDKPVIWGGVHPSSCPEECAKIADYICIGEGEQTLLDIASAIDAENRDFRHINNLAWYQDGTLIKNPLNPLVADLDTVPFAHQLPPNCHIQLQGEVEPLTMRHLRRHKIFYGSMYRTSTSRGCPYRCGYCWNGAIFAIYPDWRVRRRSAENVIRELEQAVKDGPTIAQVSFMDDCLLSANKEYLQELLHQYKKRVGIPFMAKASPRVVTDESMKMLVDAGCAWIHIGLESASERVCRDVFCRNISHAVLQGAISIASKYPVAINYDLITDNPFETPEEELAAVQTLAEIPKPYFMQMLSLVFFHQTKIRERALQECPEYVTDPCTIDFYQNKKTDLNALKRMAVTLPSPLMRRLIDAYRRNPKALSTRWMIQLGVLTTSLVFQPITYLQLLHRSQQYSIKKTLHMLLYLMDFRFFSAFNVFWTKSDSTEE